MDKRLSVDDYIEQRNDIQLSAESLSKDFADMVWTELGVANRHISRVLDGLLPLRIVAPEIESCLRRARGILDGTVPSLTISRRMLLGPYDAEIVQELPIDEIKRRYPDAEIQKEN